MSYKQIKQGKYNTMTLNTGTMLSGVSVLQVRRGNRVILGILFLISP